MNSQLASGSILFSLLIFLNLILGCAGATSKIDVKAESDSQPGHQKLAAPFLKAETAIPLVGQSGHFDYMEVDVEKQRLLVAHPGGQALVILDLTTGKPLPPIVVGHV